MARLARNVVPGAAHHVTQRGNRREPIFFEPGDREVYRDLLAEAPAGARSIRPHTAQAPGVVC
jgi:putative transposase